MTCATDTNVISFDLSIPIPLPFGIQPPLVVDIPMWLYEIHIPIPMPNGLPMLDVVFYVPSAVPPPCVELVGAAGDCGAGCDSCGGMLG